MISRLPIMIVSRARLAFGAASGKRFGTNYLEARYIISHKQWATNRPQKNGGLFEIEAFAGED